MLFVAGGDGAEVLELVKVSLDGVAKAIEERAESGNVCAGRHRLDARPRAAFSEAGAHGVGVVSGVREKDLALADVVQHVRSALSVMGLTCGEFQLDRRSVGVAQRMDLGRQAAS